MSLTNYESDNDHDGHRESMRAGGSGFRVHTSPASAQDWEKLLTALLVTPHAEARDVLLRTGEPIETATPLTVAEWREVLQHRLQHRKMQSTTTTKPDKT